jgi:ABC-type sugar transport system substrate-binding protein
VKTVPADPHDEAHAASAAYPYKSASSRASQQRQVDRLRKGGRAAVLVITLASATLSFSTYGISVRTLAASLLVLVFLASLLGNAITFHDARTRKTNVRYIAFLTPSSGDQPFYASMLSGLVRSAALALGQNYVVIPSMPTESFETVSIWSLFASLEDRQLDIDGIIFIPDHPDEHFDELVRFHEDRGDIPLVLVDVYFDLPSCDERTRKRLPSFVGGDENAGGALAADIIAEAVGPVPDGPVALIVNGASAPWEQQRAKAFRSCLAAKWPGCAFIETRSIDYSRSDAFAAVLAALGRHAAADRTIAVHAIFACNDDMAIGARGAISRLVRERYIFTVPPQIVGYDGITEIREYLSADDPYIAGTVDVRIDEQAREAMMLVHGLLRSGARQSQLKLIEPTAVKRLHYKERDSDGD